MPPTSSSNRGTHDALGYTVVARRYRPQRFEDVVGQDHVVQALRNAVRLGRVTHAYLFSGTRGVGKTSVARIFAKCLNCVQGPTETPCNNCDLCQSISMGQDVDVIEIDGASNNGVEQVRELRQNANLRPSRSRYKIYYIDEVHMLSTGAFNALLKTLEEPPEHVKFFFATTEAHKIPITVLSRCQRFDFAGIGPEQMIESLAEICRLEGLEAEPEALAVIARRAAGSMRDAQSLLEQLLSSGTKLTSELVHRSLGLAQAQSVLELVEALADHDTAQILKLCDQTINAGVQPAELLSGMLECLRDLMVLSAGAGPSAMLTTAPGDRPRLAALVERWPLDSILAALQILAEARARLRGSPHARLLLELALCRTARLENFSELSALLERLDGFASKPASPPAPAKKKSLPELDPTATEQVPNAAEPQSQRSIPPPGPTPAVPPPAPRPAQGTPTERAHPPEAPEPLTLDLDTIIEAWPRVAARLGASLGHNLRRLSPERFQPPGSVVVAVPSILNWAADLLDNDDARPRVEEALRHVFQQPIDIIFNRESPSRSTRREPRAPTKPINHPELEADSLVQDVVKLFEARAVQVETEEEPDLI